MEDSAVKEFFFLKKKKTISAQPAARSITRTPGSSQQQGCRQSHTCDEQTCLSGHGTRKNQDNPDKDNAGGASRCMWARRSRFSSQEMTKQAERDEKERYTNITVADILQSDGQVF